MLRRLTGDDWLRLGHGRGAEGERNSSGQGWSGSSARSWFPVALGGTRASSPAGMASG